MSWKERLFDLDIEEPENVDAIDDERTRASHNDVGLVNDSSGSGIMARDNGILEGFASYGLGFRFNPDTQSLGIFAPNTILFTNNFLIKDHNTSLESYLKDERAEVLSYLRKE